jgi:hypothetical protein
MQPPRPGTPQHGVDSIAREVSEDVDMCELGLGILYTPASEHGTSPASYIHATYIRRTLLCCQCSRPDLGDWQED